MQPCSPNPGLGSSTEPRLLVTKSISSSDVSNSILRSGRVILPRVQMELCYDRILALGKSQLITKGLASTEGENTKAHHRIESIDDHGYTWEFSLKRWTSQQGGFAKPIFVIENTAECMKTNRAAPGHILQILEEDDRLRISVLRPDHHNHQEAPASGSGAGQAYRQRSAAQVSVAAGARGVPPHLLAPCSRSPGCQKGSGHPGFCTGTQFFRNTKARHLGPYATTTTSSGAGHHQSGGAGVGGRKRLSNVRKPGGSSHHSRTPFKATTPSGYALESDVPIEVVVGGISSGMEGSGPNWVDVNCNGVQGSLYVKDMSIMILDDRKAVGDWVSLEAFARYAAQHGPPHPSPLSTLPTIYVTSRIEGTADVPLSLCMASLPSKATPSLPAGNINININISEQPRGGGSKSVQDPSPMMIDGAAGVVQQPEDLKWVTVSPDMSAIAENLMFLKEGSPTAGGSGGGNGGATGVGMRKSLRKRAVSTRYGSPVLGMSLGRSSSSPSRSVSPTPGPCSPYHMHTATQFYAQETAGAAGRYPGVAAAASMPPHQLPTSPARYTTSFHHYNHHQQEVAAAAGAVPQQRRSIVGRDPRLGGQAQLYEPQVNFRVSQFQSQLKGEQFHYQQHGVQTQPPSPAASPITLLAGHLKKPVASVGTHGAGIALFQQVLRTSTPSPSSSRGRPGLNPPTGTFNATSTPPPPRSPPVSAPAPALVPTHNVSGGRGRGNGNVRHGAHNPTDTTRSIMLPMLTHSTVPRAAQHAQHAQYAHSAATFHQPADVARTAAAISTLEQRNVLLQGVLELIGAISQRMR